MDCVVWIATVCLATAARMATSSTSWRSLPLFQEKLPDFIDAVAAYLESLNAMTLQQRRDLAVFKAAELINALIEVRERSLLLSNGEVIDLRDPLIRELIDEGCRLFHAGKRDEDVY